MATRSIQFMPDNEVGPETEQAPTAAAPDAATAYSAEPLDYEDPDEYPTEQIVSRSWSVAAGIAALVVTLGAVVAVLVWLVGQPAPSAPQALPVPAPSSVTVTPTAPSSPPPTTVVETQTVTATPEAVPTTVETVAATPVVDLALYDQKFVAQLRSENWYIYDPAAFAQKAHMACGMFQQGYSADYVNAKFAQESGLGMDAALQFTSAAMLIYPNCP